MLPSYSVLDERGAFLLIWLWGAIGEILTTKGQDQICPGKDHYNDKL